MSFADWIKFFYFSKVHNYRDGYIGTDTELLLYLLGRKAKLVEVGFCWFLFLGKKN
jgi:hypothetical protein